MEDGNETWCTQWMVNVNKHQLSLVLSQGCGSHRLRITADLSRLWPSVWSLQYFLTSSEKWG